MNLILTAIALLVATSGVAEAGPVAAAFAVVGAWFTTTFGAVVGGFLFRTITSVALSALATAIRGKPSVRQPGITTNTTTAGGTISQRLIFGTYATAGQMVAPMMVYQTDGNPNEWLVYVISLADKPVTGLGRIFVDGKALTIDGNPAASAHGNAMGATVLASGDDSLRDKVYIRFHNGRQTAADAYLRRVFGTYPERPWTADMIGTGVAYVVVTFKGKSQDGDYSGFPAVKFEVDGHALYDPRDGTQNPSNETTWKFSRNPAVIGYNILRGIDIPGGDRWGVGTRGFLTSHVIAAANLCDEIVPTPAGGTRVRYQAGLEISVGDEPHQALIEVVKAMGGDVADMGGTWLLIAGEPDGSVLSIADDDIIVTDSRSLRPYPGLDETVNAIHASYPDPAQQWEAKEAMPLYNAAYEAKDGGRRLIAEVDFPAVPYPVQVRTLMREMLADHRRMRTHVITLPPDALGVRLGEHISWTSAINGYAAKLFKVCALRVDPQSLCVAMTLTERDPTDYDYDPGSDGRLPTVPSPTPVRPVIVGVADWSVTPVNAGGRPGIRLAWNPEINADAVSWTIRRASSGLVVNRGSMSDIAQGSVTIAAGLLPVTEYLVTGRLVLRRATQSTQEVSVTTLAIYIGDSDFEGGIKKLFRDQGMYAIEYMASLPATGAFVGQLIFNTTTGKLHRWTGSAWVEVVAGALQGALDETNFAQGISIPRVVSSLPAVGNYQGRIVTLSTDGKLYRYHNGAWTAQVGAQDVNGQLVAAQIAAGAIGADQLAAGAIVASKVAITDWTNLVPDDQIQDVAAWTIQASSGNVTHEPNSVGAPNAQSKGSFRVDAGGANPTTIISMPSSARVGDEFFLSGQVLSNAAATIRIGLQFLDRNGAFVAGYLTPDTAATGWRTLSLSAVAPPGTAFVRMYYNIPANSYGGGVSYFATPIVRLKGRGELIVDGTLTGDKIVANTITGGLLATAGIITTAAQIEGAVIRNAHIENLTIGPDKIQVDGLSNLWNASFADVFTRENNWIELGRLVVTAFAANTKLFVTGQSLLRIGQGPSISNTARLRVLINGAVAFQRNFDGPRPSNNVGTLPAAEDWVSIVGMRRAVAGANNIVVQYSSLGGGDLSSPTANFDNTSIYVTEFKR